MLDDIEDIIDPAIETRPAGRHKVDGTTVPARVIRAGGHVPGHFRLALRGLLRALGDFCRVNVTEGFFAGVALG
jgi:hypothetical protein